MPVLRELGRGSRLGALASLDLFVWCAGRNLELELDQELHHVTVAFAAMNSRRALFTSSGCVQAMLCGPPSTATSVQSAIRAGSRAAVASNGRIRSSVPWTTSTGTSSFDTSSRKSVSQESTQAYLANGDEPAATLKLACHARSLMRLPPRTPT